MKPVKDEVRRFLTEELGLGDVAAVRDDDPLLELGIVDSIKVFPLIAFLERSFGVTLPKESLKVESFESIDAIAALVEAQKSR